jgi:hypothetical protein
MIAMKIAVFRGRTRFGGACCLHLQGRRWVEKSVFSEDANRKLLQKVGNCLITPHSITSSTGAAIFTAAVVA